MPTITHPSPHRPLGKSLVHLVLAAAMLGPAAMTLRAEESGSPGVVSHVKVLSNKVEDVSSLEAWKHSFIKDGMDEQAKAIAVWTTVVKFRHQTHPPHEFLSGDDDVDDPIKAFNVYGYGMCCCASSCIEALGRYAGLEARGWAITGHSVPELKVNGNWGMFDASLIDYFKKPNGTIAGVQEISQSITDWLVDHPDLKGVKDHQIYYKFMANGGWRKGPAILNGSATYDDRGWQPAHTHAWGDSMIEFGHGDTNYLFEYGSAVGYEVNIQLRPGEKLVRNWSNKGLDVNQAEGAKPSNMLTDSPLDPKGDMRYAPGYGDLTTARIGNGTLEYDLPLASGAFRGGMLTADNLAATSEDQAGPAVHVKDASKPGVLIFRMPCSYVYLDGELRFIATVGNGGSIVVSLSQNNGLDWTEIASVTDRIKQMVALKPMIYRRYDYRLKFELKGAGTGLDAVSVINDIQHSQRPLPILDKGDNQITYSAGAQEGTITAYGSLPHNGEGKQGQKNLIFNDFHPVLEGVSPERFNLERSGGTVTVPIQTPGDMTRLRIGCFYRADDASDGWTIEASFDEGKTFVPVAALEGPNNGNSKYVVFGKVPAGIRAVQVRLTGHKKVGQLFIAELRIDADYKEPHGGLTPIKITYAYDEEGQPKTDVHVAKGGEENYTIHCEGKPVMKSITLELAP